MFIPYIEVRGLHTKKQNTMIHFLGRRDASVDE